MNAGGVLGVDELPVVPGLRRRDCSPRRTTRTSRSPSSRRTTTGTSTSGAAPTRAGSSRWRCPVLWDPELAAAEVRRSAAKGCHSLTFTENPAALGYPSFHAEHWDPLWKALVDTDTSCSRSTSARPASSVTAADAPVDVMMTLQPMNICQAAADMMWSRIPKEFPDIRIALSEGGTGWIPYFLDALDRTYDIHHLWTGQDFGSAAQRDLPRALPHLLHRRPGGRQAAPPHRYGQHRVGVRLPARRLGLAGSTGGVWHVSRRTCRTTS